MRSFTSTSRHLLQPTLLALAAASCATAYAQNNTLSEVVVSATGFEQELKQAPASISVVTREELEKKSFRDLAEALQGVEGVDVRGGTGKTGGFDISMRGMPSEYTLVLIDGRRTNPAGDTTPNGFGTAFTSLIPPMSAIERIEVIRGPMSTLYGSDAMGGVINIITRKVAKQWGGSVQVEGSVPEHSHQGAVQKTSFYLNGPIQTDKLGLAVRGSYFNRDGSTLPDMPVIGNHRGLAPVKSDQYNLGARLTLTPSAGHEFWLDAETARSSYDNRNCELGDRDGVCGTGNAGTTIAGYADEMRFNRDTVGVGYKGKISLGLLEASLTHAANESEGRTMPTAAFGSRDPNRYLIGTPRVLESATTAFDAKLVSPLGEQHLLSTGMQIAHTSVKDGVPMSRGTGTFKQNTWALFAEDEWSITDQLTATGGLRYDHHDKFGGHWSPRAYLVWAANDIFTVKGGVSRGFRAPKVNQLVEGLTGMSGQGRSSVLGNPDLQPETSTSTELGLLFNNQKGWTGSATVFHNKIKDRITSVNCASSFAIAGCAASGTAAADTSFGINADEGTTKGLELASKYVLNNAWSMSGSYTWTDSEAVVGGIKTGKLSDTAKHVASATLNWSPNTQWNAWLQGEYRGKSRRFNTFDTAAQQAEKDAVGNYLKGYGLLHVGVSYKLNKSVTLSGTVNNLLDKDFNKFTNANGTYYSQYFKGGQSTKGSNPDGRTLWLKANVQF